MLPSMSVKRKVTVPEGSRPGIPILSHISGFPVEGGVLSKPFANPRKPRLCGGPGGGILPETVLLFVFCLAAVAGAGPAFCWRAGVEIRG